MVMNFVISLKGCLSGFRYLIRLANGTPVSRSQKITLGTISPLPQYNQQTKTMNPSLQQLATTLLWSENDNSTPEGGEPFDKNYTVYDIDGESLGKLHQQFQAFVSKAEAKITELKGSSWTSIDEFYTGPDTGGFYLEHDYIMTVNGHGCGFWEKSDWKPEVGQILTNLAEQEKRIQCFTDHIDHGQDGKVYIEFG
jgi:hypothetical protein